MGQKMSLPKVWHESLGDYVDNELKQIAARQFRIHQLPLDLEVWKKRREELRELVRKHTGMTGYDPNLGLDMRETGSIRMDGYTVKNVVFRSRENFYVTGNLYLPDGEGPFPGVLGVHGHWKQGRLAERVQARGHTLAKNGYVSLQIDAFGSGERSTVHGEFEYHGANLGGSLMNIGETLMAIQICDGMRGIDLLCSLDCVDSSKIGVTGASGGGNQTMWISAMDERVKASMPVVSVGTFESYITRANCICELLPDGLTFTEESGILALMAPKALKICNCLGDTNPTFYPAEMLRSYAETRKVYQIYGESEKFAYQIFNLPHGYWPEIREAMLGWFNLHLKGIGHGMPKEEVPFDTLPESDVMVYPKGERPAEVISIAEYCRKKGGELREKNISNDKINGESKLDELKNILRLGNKLVIKKAHEYTPDSEWRRLALETQCGRMLPLLVRQGEPNAGVRIIAHPVSKERIDEKDLEGNQTLIIADCWGTGETNPPPADAGVFLWSELARACLWLGKTVIGEWIRDFTLIAEFAAKEFQDEKIVLSGYGESGLAAIFASALHPEFHEVTTYDTPVTYLYGKSQPVCSMGVHLPGIINWGDISLAAALSDADIEFVRPQFLDGTKLTPEQCGEFSSEFSGLKNKCASSGKVKLG